MTPRDMSLRLFAAGLAVLVAACNAGGPYTPPTDGEAAQDTAVEAAGRPAKSETAAAVPERAAKTEDDVDEERKGAKLAAIEFAKISVPFSRGTRIGSYTARLGRCGGSGPVTWKGGRFNARDPEFADVFIEEMTDADFTVAGATSDMFRERRERAPYAIGAKISEIRLKICRQLAGYPTYFTNRESGEGWVTVDWEVFSRLRRKIVYRTTTKGFFKSLNAVDDGISYVVLRAFAEAAGRFATDEKLAKILSRGDPEEVKEAVPVTDAKLEIARIDRFSDPISRNMVRVRRAAVTVLSGEGHGSGFFITRAGHLLTNYHVVGDADQVRVRMAMGMELIGRVLRRHKARDVALVKIDAAGTGALPVRPDRGRIGEDVYAIGTPLDVALSTTVTKGIISAIRRMNNDKLVYLQADVDIHGGNSGGPLLDESGNLVGMTVSGISSDQTSVGLNFFIPINDALEKLRIELVDPRKLRTSKR